MRQKKLPHSGSVAVSPHQSLVKTKETRSIFKRFGFADALSHITKKLGFGDVTQIHSLRHTYITHLIRAGNDLPTVKEQAGHKSISTTMRYVDVFADQKRRAANSLSYGNADKGATGAIC